MSEWYSALLALPRLWGLPLWRHRRSQASSRAGGGTEQGAAWPASPRKLTRTSLCHVSHPAEGQLAEAFHHSRFKQRSDGGPTFLLHCVSKGLTEQTASAPRFIQQHGLTQETVQMIIGTQEAHASEAVEYVPT